MHQFADLSHDDEELHDMSKDMPKGYEPPEYPSGCCFHLSKEDLAKAGAEDGDPGDTMRFSAMGEVISVVRGIDYSRIELQIGEFAGEDGKFFELSTPAYISLQRPQLEKMDLDDDCERGDMLHMMGTVRMEHLTSTEYGGDMVGLQITHLTAIEDESDESRKGGDDD